MDQATARSPAIHRHSDNSNNSLIESTKTPPKRGKKPQQQQQQSTGSTNNMSPSLAKNAFKNAKITNFFSKINNPSPAPLEADNHPQLDNQDSDDFVVMLRGRDSSRDSSASGMRQIPNSQNDRNSKIEYVYIHPSSDDDTNSSVRRIPVKSDPAKSPRGPKRTRESIKDSPQHYTVNTSFKDPTNNNNPKKNSTNGNLENSPLEKKKTKIELTTLSTNKEAQKVYSGKSSNLDDRPSKVIIDFQSVPSDLNLSKTDANALIKKMFLVDMPDDFHSFWDFAKTINHRKPSSAFTPLLNWTLAGPFDVLSGLVTDFHGFSKEKLLCHCRYYYDPPEFQTIIIKKDSDLTHFGYYRDEPDQKNPVVVSNCATKGGYIQAMGDNLFTLLKSEVDAAILSLSQPSQETKQNSTGWTGNSHKSKQQHTIESANAKQSPLEKAKQKQELEILRDKLIDYCQSNARHNPISYDSWSKTKTRKAKCVAKTLNGFGIVVPMDDDVGYRNLGVTDKKLTTMLDRISKFNDEDKTKCGHYNELHQLITNANMANDECDFGMGLELGLDLFFNGDKFFHKNVEFLLTNAYTLLDRTEFLEILQAHLSHRKKGYRVSLLLVEK